MSQVLLFCHFQGEGRSHSLLAHNSPRLSTGSINPFLVYAPNTSLCPPVELHCKDSAAGPAPRSVLPPAHEEASSIIRVSQADTESRSALLTSAPHCFLFKKKNAAPKTQFRIFTIQVAKRLKALVTETWDSPWLGAPCSHKLKTLTVFTDTM